MDNKNQNIDKFYADEHKIRSVLVQKRPGMGKNKVLEGLKNTHQGVKIKGEVGNFFLVVDVKIEE